MAKKIARKKTTRGRTVPEKVNKIMGIKKGEVLKVIWDQIDIGGAYSLTVWKETGKATFTVRAVFRN